MEQKSCMLKNGFISKFALVVASGFIVLSCKKENPPINSIESVTICDQVWMKQNLNVVKYKNGDPIPQVTDPSVWAELTTGAWCFFDNDSTTGEIYGKLYNFYAVVDPRGLAPRGWHVPSDAEWTTLGNCLGGDTVAGSALKETGTAHWLGSNADATNSSGFTGLPGGSRDLDGDIALVAARTGGPDHPVLIRNLHDVLPIVNFARRRDA